MFVGINHVTVVVNDKKEADNFYFGILGLEKVVVGNSLWAKVGNQYIHINENSSQIPQKSFQHFAIEIQNLENYLNGLIGKRVEVFDLDDDLQKTDININLSKKNRNYFISDPFGNMIEFIDSSNKFFKQ